MGKLILFELKKIFKKRINIVLIVLVLCGISFFSVKSILLDTFIAWNEFATFDNQKLSTIETYRYMDEILHQQAGMMDDRYADRIEAYRKSILDEY